MKYKLDHEAKTFGDWAYLAVAKHYKKFLSHELAVLEDKDPEELHQMRVGMRRLRSAFNGFTAALNLPENGQGKKVGKIAKSLGNLRDLDVLEDTLKNKYYPHLPNKEQKRLKEVLYSLEKNRKKAFKKVRETLNSQNYFDLKQAFAHWLKHPKYHDIAQVSIETILADILLPEVSQLMLHPGWLIGFDFASQTNNLSKKTVESLLDKDELILHDLRKVGKRTRYNMELFTQFYDHIYQTYVTDVKGIQSILGDIQDSFVLAEFLNEICDDNILSNLPTFCETLQDSRYQKWQEWENLQQKILNHQTRKNLYLTILEPCFSNSQKVVEEIVATNIP